MLLLSNEFEAFRNTCPGHYKLEHYKHYKSIIYIAWIGLANVSEKKRGIRLELLTDSNMLLMLERGIRVGIIQAAHQYAKARNKYTNDPEGENSFLQYLDVNNLYGLMRVNLCLIRPTVLQIVIARAIC